jgi:plasminogen activator inhibitor 1 RNA-binding protein
MTDSDKKVHNGWGGDDGNAELKVEEAATFDAAVDSGTNDWVASASVDAGAADWGVLANTSSNDWDAPADTAAPTSAAGGEKPDGGRRREPEPEEEDNTLTLDEYLARQKENDLVPKLEVRKANDGADETIWDGATRLEKTDGEAYFSGKTKSAPKARTEKKEKVFLEIDATFPRPSRGRGGDRDLGEGRGVGRARGRGRGGPGRGPRGGSNGNSPTVRVDDEAAFPSLS